MTEEQKARYDELKAKEVTSTEELAELAELEKLLVVPAEEPEVEVPSEEEPEAPEALGIKI
jgi:hypothetical protein